MSKAREIPVSERQGESNASGFMIELPYLPPRALSPNGRVHWTMRYRAAQSMKDDVMVLVLLARNNKRFRPLEKATLMITWLAKDKRARDMDNLLGATKSAIDGLVRAGVLQTDDARNVKMVLAYEDGQDRNATVLEVLAREPAPEARKESQGERG